MPFYRRLPPSRRNPTGLWQATVRTPTGRRTKTDQYKSVVKKWAEDQEARMRRGEWADPRDGQMTLDAWWRQWCSARDVELATERREESHWRVHIEPRWGKVRLAQIQAWDVEAWAAQLAKDGVGATTRSQVLRLLRTLLAEAARHRMIPVDPTGGVKIPTPPKHVDRFLTQQEYRRLEACFDDPTLVRLLTFAGLRWGEAAGLHAHRVDVARAELNVVETLRRDGSIKPVPKSKAGRRYVPLTPLVLELLEPRLPESGLVFRSPSGGPLDYTNWRRREWVPALEKAGLADPQPTPHDLRHTFGSWLAERGVPPVEIMALMGHSSLRATERYLHSGDGRMQRARAALTWSPTP